MGRFFAAVARRQNRPIRRLWQDARILDAVDQAPNPPALRKPSFFRPRNERHDRGERYDWKKFLKSQAALSRNLLADSSSSTKHHVTVMVGL